MKPLRTNCQKILGIKKNFSLQRKLKVDLLHLFGQSPFKTHVNKNVQFDKRSVSRFHNIKQWLHYLHPAVLL